MSTLLSPPPERDLPPAAHSAARSRVVGAVRPTRARRGWLPVAAAAGVLVVAGGAAVAVSRPQPAGTGTHSPAAGAVSPESPALADAELSARCLRAAGGEAGATLRAALRDGRGSVVWVAGGSYSALCSFDPAGGLDGPPVRGFLALGAEGTPTSGYAPATDAHLTLGSWIGLIEGSRPPTAQLLFFGQVSRDVVRVRARWGDRPWVEAAVRGPYYLAGATAAPVDGQRPELRGSVIGYDRAGHTPGPLDFLE